MTARYVETAHPFTADARDRSMLVGNLAVREGIGPVRVRWARPLADHEAADDSLTEYNGPVRGWAPWRTWRGTMWDMPPEVWLVVGEADRATAAHEVRHLVQMRRDYHGRMSIGEREADADQWSSNVTGIRRERAPDPIHAVCAPPPVRTVPSPALEPFPRRPVGRAHPRVPVGLAGLGRGFDAPEWAGRLPILSGLEFRGTWSYIPQQDVVRSQARELLRQMAGMDWRRVGHDTSDRLWELRGALTRVAAP